MTIRATNITTPPTIIISRIDIQVLPWRPDLLGQARTRGLYRNAVKAVNIVNVVKAVNVVNP